MDNTDKDQTEFQTPWTTVALQKGVVLGLITGIISLLTLMTNSSGNFVLGLISFIITIALVVSANRDFKKLNNGSLTYGQGFKISFATVFLAGVISGVLTYIYLGFIDPSALEAIKEAKMVAFEKLASVFGSSFPEEELDKAMAEIEAKTTAFGTLRENLSGAAFEGLLLGLIIPAFTKHTRSDYE